MAKLPKPTPVCVTAQFPAPLAQWLTEHARSRTATVSQVLRELVIRLKDETFYSETIPGTKELRKLARR